MASAKQIEQWVREVAPNARHVAVARAKAVVRIDVDARHFDLPLRGISFAQIAAALLTLGPSCAEDGAKHEH